MVDYVLSARVVEVLGNEYGTITLTHSLTKKKKDIPMLGDIRNKVCHVVDYN
jgi:hypothetical protein